MRDAELLGRRADGGDDALYVERAAELVDGGAQHLIGIVAPARPLRDAVRDRLAIRARLGFAEGDRRPDGGREELRPKRRELEAVGRESTDAARSEQRDAHETIVRDDRQCRERAHE